MSCLNVAADVIESNMHGRIQHSVVDFLQRTYNRRGNYSTQVLRRGLFAVPEARSNRLTIYIWIPGFCLTMIAVCLFRKSWKIVFTFCTNQGWLGGVVVSMLGLMIERSRVRLPTTAPSGNNSGQVANTHLPLSPSSTIWYRPKGGDALRPGR